MTILIILQPVTSWLKEDGTVTTEEMDSEPRLQRTVDMSADHDVENKRTNDVGDEPFELFDPDLESTLAKLETERKEADRIWQQCKTDRHLASPGSKYPRYDLAVDQEHGDRALEIKLGSWKRPHMRALHCAWISFFLAFVIWVAPAPLLREIQLSLALSKRELWTSSITNDFTAIVTRIAIGPICDAYGARLPMAFVLIFASIPTAMVGLVQSGTDLAIIRFFIGVAGSSFGTIDALLFNSVC